MPYHINLIPQQKPNGKTLVLNCTGDILTFNGATLDLTVIPEGATLPRAAVDCEWLAGPIRRIDGVLHLTLILPFGDIPYPPPPEAQAVLYPEPITVTEDGPITLPSWTPPAPEPAPEDAE